MGCGSSAVDYEAELRADHVLQSVEVVNGKPLAVGEKGEAPPPGSTWPRRNINEPELTFGARPTGQAPPGLQSAWECFVYAVNSFPQNPMLGTRTYKIEETAEGEGGAPSKKYVMDPKLKAPARGPFVWEKFRDVHEIVSAIGSGLLELGCRPPESVGIFSKNRAEWIFSALGVWAQGLSIVALYATLGDGAVEYIANHAETRVIFSEKQNIKSLIALKPKLKTATTIVQYDYNPLYGNIDEVLDQEMVESAAQVGLRVISLSELIALGKKAAHGPNPPQATDLAYIMYTSGTTGNPKGVMLTHINICSAAGATAGTLGFTVEDSYLSFLPLAHIFETVGHVLSWIVGGKIGFYQGDIRALSADWLELRPTVMAGVPRVYMKLYQRVHSAVAEKGWAAKVYFNRAFAKQSAALRAKKPRIAEYDKKLFLPIKEKMGLDKVRVLITGAAPCPGFLMEFLRVVIAPVVQGYGLTETAVGACVSDKNDMTCGSCGPPVSCAEVRLIDVPEMGYEAKNNQGEVQIRGPNVFVGYFKEREQTEAVLDKDGWFSTGDIGRWNPNGTLSIIDRRKNIFKLSNGEYVAAERVENIYAKCRLVAQVWVYGGSFQDYCVAVVVPAAEELYKVLQEKKLWPRPADSVHVGNEQFREDFLEVCTGSASKQVTDLVFNAMKLVGGALKRHEQVLKIHLEAHLDATLMGFTEANDCMTPTFKLKRNFLLQRYQAAIDALYAAPGDGAAGKE